MFLVCVPAFLRGSKTLLPVKPLESLRDSARPERQKRNYSKTRTETSAGTIWIIGGGMGMCKPSEDESCREFESFYLVHLERCGRTLNRLANESIELRLRVIASAFAFLAVVPRGNPLLVSRADRCTTGKRLRTRSLFQFGSYLCPRRSWTPSSGKSWPVRATGSASHTTVAPARRSNRLRRPAGTSHG